jgi:formiminotetrahydrofolate cyclodeaminase
MLHALGGFVADSSALSWIDDLVLRASQPGGALSPFQQAVVAGEQIARIAEDRSGLGREAYDDLGTARHQARLLSELARLLDEDVTGHAHKADAAPSRDVDPVQRAREHAVALSGMVRATATLVDTCHSLLLIADRLLAVRRTRSRLELMAAVGTIRAAASTAHLTVLANLPRLTDSTLYDELEAGLETVEVTLGLADRVSRTIREELTPGRALPSQRVSR